jgi:ubiquinone/menaquinone biosynthesis C-methylase UbiE
MAQPDQEEDYLARGFRNVDTAVVGKMAQCLEFVNSLPSFQYYKNSILEAMDPKPDSIIADLGCGMGFDVARLARLIGLDGLAIGVDSSKAFLESARSMSKNSAGIQFIHADIQNLPFDTGYLHACKVDRTLQHIESPASVLREMFRTVRPGGTVVCAEPDWGTFTIDDDDRSTVKQIAALWEENIRNPWIGRQLSPELSSLNSRLR